MLQVTMVGATFRPAKAKDIIKGLSIGDFVDLRADPDNEFDDTAVAVYYDDVHIGFVPKESNSALFASLQEGNEHTAEIIAFESTIKPVLEIDLNGDTDSAQDEGGW